MKTKEEFVQKHIVDIIATCGSISKNNPRSANVEKNPLTKRVRAFSRAFEEMEVAEIMDMAKTFYNNYYLEAIEDESVSDWMDSDIHLNYGDSDLIIKLPIGDYFRIAKDIEQQKGAKKWSSILRHDVLKMLIRMASPTMAEKLDEKLHDVEALIGKSSSSTSGAAGTLPAGMGDIGDMLKNVVSGFSSKMNEMGGMKDMLNNPQAKSFIDGMTTMFPAEMQAPMKTMIDDLSSGTFDISKTVQTLVSSMGTHDDSGREMANLIDLGEEESHTSTTSEVVPSHSSASVVCHDDCCYIQN